MKSNKLFLALGVFVVLALSQLSFAQGLNWEGQTGALLTPFAYTASSPAGKFGKPEVAFHYLNAGDVIGNDYQFSITEGIAKRLEFGYTGAMSSEGSTPGLSPLFTNGFHELHGKVLLINENMGKRNWVPAISVGAIGRLDVERIASAVGVGSASRNADFYIVGTKTITQIKGLPILLNFGERVTDAQLFGAAGNAPHWQGRLMGTAAFVVNGPAKTTLIFGSEAVQQPHHADGLPNIATFATSLTYFIRAVPHIAGTPLAIDVGVAQLGGRIVNNVGGLVVDLDARHQVGMGVSYNF
jgi:hypothetical protein